MFTVDGRKFWLIFGQMLTLLYPSFIMLFHLLWVCPTFCNCIFLGIIALCHATLSSASSFVMLMSLSYFVITSLIKHSYHSPEVTKTFKRRLFRWMLVINYAELFMEFWGSDTLFQSNITDLANHTIVSRCETAFCFAGCWSCFATI